MMARLNAYAFKTATRLPAGGEESGPSQSPNHYDLGQCHSQLTKKIPTLKRVWGFSLF